LKKKEKKMPEDKKSVSLEKGKHTVPIGVTMEFEKVYLGSTGEGDSPFVVFVSYFFNGFPYAKSELRESLRKLLITSALEIARLHQEELDIKIPNDPNVDLYGQNLVGISLI
jgi:hypothetical protein